MDNDLIRQGWAGVDGLFETVGRPHRLFKCDRSRTALVVIDMQNGFVAPGASIEAAAGRDIVDNINSLAQGCRAVGVPVIWVVSKYRSEADWGLITKFEPVSPVSRDRKPPVCELAWDADGAKMWPGMEVDAYRDFEVVKVRYSAFISGSSNIERLLRTLGRNNLIIVGVATNVCVAATAIDAMMLDFEVTVVSDATATFSDLYQQVFLMSLRSLFADVLPTSEILDELKQLG